MKPNPLETQPIADSPSEHRQKAQQNGRLSSPEATLFIMAATLQYILTELLNTIFSSHFMVYE